MRKTLSFHAVLILLFFVCAISTAALAQIRAKTRAFAGAVDKIKPSVVRVSVEKTFIHPRKPGAPEGEVPVKVIGSGMIIREEGYVLTCEHLLEKAKKIEVIDVDGKRYRATIIGKDALTDIAVLKVTLVSKKLPIAELGKSIRVRPGEWVIAVGNPENLEQAVTVGVVSGISEGPRGTEYIQTDALIRPGDSGGPLLNEEGKVIGINSSTISGFGRSIPIDLAMAVANQLIKHGEVARGYLGVSGQDLTEELAVEFGLKSIEGVLIGDIEHYSPAEKYGLMVGDVFLKFDDQAIKNTRELARIETETAPHKAVRVEIIRDKESKSISLELGQFKDEASQNEEIEKDLGFRVEDISEAWKKKVKMESTEGVVVSQVQAASAASAAGLAWGDVIVEVDRKKVRNQHEFYRIIDSLDEKKNVLMLIERAGKTLYLIVKIDQAP